MNIVEAAWDERVFGCKCFEVVLSPGDSLDEFIATEKKILAAGGKHIVVKSPVNSPELLYGLPTLEYTFVECGISLLLRKKSYSCPAFVTRFDRKSEVKALKKGELDRVYRELSRGMFDSDRVSLDRNFTEEQASQRYINWIGALFDEGQPVYEVCLDGDAIGFFVLREIDSTKIQGVLTGLYEKYERSGFGAVLMKKLNDTVWEGGYEVYLAQVASNNLKALRSNQLFGSEIDGLTYNYVKFVQ